jgi:hypothetical protein
MKMIKSIEMAGKKQQRYVSVLTCHGDLYVLNELVILPKKTFFIFYFFLNEKYVKDRWEETVSN